MGEGWGSILENQEGAEAERNLRQVEGGYGG